jgi:hypothetical protein
VPAGFRAGRLLRFLPLHTEPRAPRSAYCAPLLLPLVALTVPAANDPERAAAHLLAGRAEGDRWVVEQLPGAATAARARGAARSAVTYLRRALEEPPGGGMRAQVLAELGEAEAAAAMPAAADHLAAAVTLSRDPDDRAVLLLERGGALRAQGAHAASPAIPRLRWSRSPPGRGMAGSSSPTTRSTGWPG